MSEEQHETHRDRQESSTVQNSVDTMTSLHKTQTKENKKESTKKDIIPVKCRRVARWYLGKTLGKGGYSWVKKGYDRHNGRVVALKFTTKCDQMWFETQRRLVENEIKALLRVRNKHVSRLLAYNLNGKYPQKDGTFIPIALLVLEYMAGGELFDILYYTHAFKETIARTYFHQLIDGISACHKSRICHRDIKPENLLLDSNFMLKIADFGLAKVFDNNNNDEKQDNKDVINYSASSIQMNTFHVGTRGYQAPEIINKEKYSFSCDIFSCGVVLFMLLAGYPPFESASNKCGWYLPLINGNARKFWKQHRGCGISLAARDLITRMIWYDKDKRIRINGIKKHKWYNSDTLSAAELKEELQALHNQKEIKRTKNGTKERHIETRNSIVVYQPPPLNNSCKNNHNSNNNNNKNKNNHKNKTKNNHNNKFNHITIDNDKGHEQDDVNINYHSKHQKENKNKDSTIDIDAHEDIFEGDHDTGIPRCASINRQVLKNIANSNCGEKKEKINVKIKYNINRFGEIKNMYSL